MLLAELIKEKDYIEESINHVQEYISSTLSVYDRTEFKINKSLIDSKIEELRDLCAKHQQFSVTVERAKAKSVIKVNDTEINLLDAVSIKKSMVNKLEALRNISTAAIRANAEGDLLLCVDIDELFKEMSEVRSDINALESKITHATWNVEVS